MTTWLSLRSLGARSLFAGLTPTYLKVLPAVTTSLLVRDACLGRFHLDFSPLQKRSTIQRD